MDIKAVIEKYYGLKRAQLECLEGFEDKTYKVTDQDKVYIFKQYQYSVVNEAVISAEDKVLEQLDKLRDHKFPKVIPALNNKPYIVTGEKIYRLLTFLEGKLLGDSKQSVELLSGFGSLLGAMDKELLSCEEIALSGRENNWDLRYLELNLPYLEYIQNPSDRNLVKYFFLQFDEMVGPVAPSLRKSIIHNDANDWNVITDGQKVTGIFDFGDLAYTWLINELAIALPYIMMNKEEPLEAAVRVLQGYHQELPLTELEISILYYLIAARLCISVCNSAYGKKVKPDSKYMVISEKPAWELLRKWVTINPLKVEAAFKKALGFSWNPPFRQQDLLKRRNMYLSKSLSLSYKKPISMYRAAFQYMYDTDGNTFLDAYNNIMLVGHCHPKVVAEGQKALASLNTNTRYLYDNIYSYAEKLLNKFPVSLNRVFFVNSGSEASDLAIRMALAHSKKNKVMVLEHGYHGSTWTGIDISHYKYASSGGQGKKPYIIEAPMPKVFGSGYEDDGTCGSYYAGITKQRMLPHMKDIGAFIAEPVMGCGGQVPLARGYLKEIYSLIREQGGVCISDEVQVGFGRMGQSFWGYDLHDVLPDMVILGKPMGNGHPIGALVTTDEIARSFEKGPEFFSSFGGNPVSCAIGKAVLEVIEEEELQKSAMDVGSHLKTLLKELQNKYSTIADVRGYGMFLGVELADPQGIPLTDVAQKVKNQLRDKHILVGTDGPFDNVIKIKPPLPFSKRNAEKLTYELDLILNSLL